MDQPGIDELDDVCIHPNYSDHKVQIGACLSSELRLALTEFLKQHHDCFVWSHKDMTGIDPDIAVYRLQVNSDYALVRLSEAIVVLLEELDECEPEL